MELLSFLRPAFLAGLAGLVIPVVIHLLGRRRVRPVPFSTLRFLRIAQAKASARWRLRRLLLLLSRLTILSALTLLFSGPGCLRPSQPDRESVYWLLILDNSPSMLASAGELSSFERAKVRLNEIVMEAREQDRFMIVTTDAGPEAGWNTGFSDDRGSVLAALSNISVRYGSHDIRTAVERAAGTLSELDNGRVVLATDLQASAWGKGRITGSIPVLQILDAGFPEARNSWIRSVEQTDEGLRIVLGQSPPDVDTEAPQVQIRQTDGSHFSTAARTGQVRIASSSYRGGDLLTISVAPGGYLSSDDSLDYPVPPDHRLNVLAVNGDPHGFVLRDETLFLRKALSPGNGVMSGVRYTEVRPSEISIGLTPDTDIVILANVGSLSKENADLLRSARDAGKGLIFTAGSNWKDLTTTGRDRSAEELALLSLLPLPLRDRVVVPTGDGLRPPFERIDPSSLTGPLTVFSNEGNGDLSDTRVRTYWVFETSIDESLRVLARLQNGAPLILERSYDRGRTLVLATSIDRDEGNLCLQPVFLPLMHRLLLHAADRLRPDIPPLWPAGEPIRLVFPWPVTVETASGHRSYVEPGGSDFVPTVPGLYTLWRDEKKIGNFSAIVPSNESDLTRLDGSGLAAILGPDGYVLASTGEDTLMSRYRTRDDMAPLTALILLAAVTAEAMLASRWRRKKPDVLWERPL